MRPLNYEVEDEHYHLGDDCWTRDNLFWGKKGEQVVSYASHKAFPEWTVKHNNFGKQYEYCCSSGVDVTLTKDNYQPIVLEVKNLADQTKPYGTDFVVRHILPRFAHLINCLKVLVITFLHLLTQKAIQLLKDNDIQIIEVGERLTTQFQITNKIHILANRLQHLIKPRKNAAVQYRPILPINTNPVPVKSSGIAKNSYTIPPSDREILEELSMVVRPHIEVNHPSFIDHPEHRKWMDKQLELAEQYSQ
jgi:hypothetical protein